MIFLYSTIPKLIINFNLNEEFKDYKFQEIKINSFSCDNKEVQSYSFDQLLEYGKGYDVLVINDRAIMFFDWNKILSTHREEFSKASDDHREFLNTVKENEVIIFYLPFFQQEAYLIINKNGSFCVMYDDCYSNQSPSIITFNTSNTNTYNYKNNLYNLIQHVIYAGCNNIQDFLFKIKEQEAKERLEQEAKERLEQEAKERRWQEEKKLLEQEAKDKAKAKKDKIIKIVALIAAVLLIAGLIYAATNDIELNKTEE